MNSTLFLKFKMYLSSFMNNIVIYKYCKRKRGGVFGPKIMRKLELILRHLYYFKKLSNFIQGDSDHHIKSINSWITQALPRPYSIFPTTLFYPTPTMGLAFSWKTSRPLSITQTMVSVSPSAFPCLAAVFDLPAPFKP